MLFCAAILTLNKILFVVNGAIMIEWVKVVTKIDIILQKQNKRTSIKVLHLLMSSKSFLDEEKCGSSQNGSRREMGTIEDIVRATKKHMSDKPILKYHRAAFLAFLRGVGGSQKIFFTAAAPPAEEAEGMKKT